MTVLSAAALLVLAVTARTADVPHISGGIGGEERDQLRLKESGEYLSDVQVVIESAKKEPMLETTMVGPILLATLPPGSYTIKATAGGRTLTQTVTVQAAVLRQVDFRWRDAR